jgi:hypothetical protein
LKDLATFGSRYRDKILLVAYATQKHDIKTPKLARQALILPLQPDILELDRGFSGANAARNEARRVSSPHLLTFSYSTQG